MLSFSIMQYVRALVALFLTLAIAAAAGAWAYAASDAPSLAAAPQAEENPAPPSAEPAPPAPAPEPAPPETEPAPPPETEPAPPEAEPAPPPETEPAPPDAEPVPPETEPAPPEVAPVPPPVPPVEDKDEGKQHKCFISGLPWEESSTRVEAIILLNGERLRGYFASLPYFFTALELFDEKGWACEVESISMLDYTTFGTSAENMIDIGKSETVTFVLTEEKLAGSAAPFIAAFVDWDTARKARDSFKSGGDLFPFAKIADRIQGQLRAKPK